MKTLLLNASLKKTGTTYLHNFFELHQDKIPNLIVPPIKEWYFIPRVSPLSTRAAVPLQHSLGQRAEEMYEKETNPQHKEFIRRVANRPSGFHMRLSEVVDRVSYILDAYEDDCIIAVNDPNFLNDCYGITYSGKGNLLEELSKSFAVKLFCVHRDFLPCQVSFIKMRHAIENLDMAGKEIPIGNLLLIPAWLDKCSIQEFTVYDMEFVTSRTSAFVKDLFASHGLRDLLGITMQSPDNPNPAKKTDYSSIANHLKFLEQRWKHFDNPAGIHQKIKMSSSEYAHALLQMHQTWQQ
jgi:hypothetical protein